MSCAAGLMLLPVSTQAHESPLAGQMETVNDAFKAFRREKDPAKGAALAREAQDAAIKSLTELPDLVKKISDPAEKAKATLEYRKMIAKLVITLCEVEAAFLANDLDKVAEQVEAIKTAKKEGHDKFMEE